MRFSSAVAVAAAIAPAAVSARGTFGYALGVRKSDKAGSCKEDSDWANDFKALLTPQFGSDPQAILPTVVRTYAAVDGGATSSGGPLCKPLGGLLKAAKSAGVKVLVGLWADTQESFNTDVTEVLNYAKDYQDTIYGFTVGSEGLYREQQKPGTGYKADYLLSCINSFKDSLKGAGVTDKKVGTADSWNKFDDGTADPLIQGGVDLFLVNAFGYWQGKDITKATGTYLDDLQLAFGHIQKLAGSDSSVELWNGETGWPTDGGSDYQDAHAGTANAQTFFTEGVCAALDWNINVFYFEAFNEPWKQASVGLDGSSGDETHWGAFDANWQPVVRDRSCGYSGPSASSS